jgi:hypothetical protein
MGAFLDSAFDVTFDRTAAARRYAPFFLNADGLTSNGSLREMPSSAIGSPIDRVFHSG